MGQHFKYLTVLRHAKSSWDFPDLSDHDRPLNDRGLRDAPRMAKLYASEVDRPDCVVCSTALRARQTAKFFIQELQLSNEKVEYTRGLFHAGASEVLSVLSKISNTYDHVMIVGHNPGFTTFVNRMAGEDIDNIPTCGVVVIQLKLNTWQDIGMGIGELEQYYYPKGSLGKHRI